MRKAIASNLSSLSLSLVFIFCVMAMAPTHTSMLRLSDPLPPGRGARRAPHHMPHASTHHSTVTVDEPSAPPAGHHQSRSALNLPATFANLLHLDTKNDTFSGNIPNVPSPSEWRTPAYSPKEDISSLRDELHGAADWSALLDPLHPWLRREIVKYGEFSQATYDAFDFNRFSQYCGSCLYARGRFFDKLGLVRHGYDVTDYVYAMSHIELPRWLERSMHAETWSRDSNWMGYVAVSGDDESRRIGCRDIVVAWRGTVSPAEWLDDVQGSLEPIKIGVGDDTGGDDKDVKVEHGFQSIYTSKSAATRYNKRSASEQAMGKLELLVQHYKARGEKISITITGHSLGGALALLNAYEAAAAMPDVPVSVISFGAPRVGNEAFGRRLQDVMGVKVLRVVVKQDLVPKVPGVLFNEGIRKIKKVTGTLEWVYTHVGVELGLDFRSSPYLRPTIDLAGFHNLEAYLHLVDGHQSANAGFRPGAKRDVALVNKASGTLRDELHVPACWYRPANGGMVCNDYGRWVMPKRLPEDIPSPYAREEQAIAQAALGHQA